MYYKGFFYAIFFNWLFDKYNSYSIKYVLFDEIVLLHNRYYSNLKSFSCEKGSVLFGKEKLYGIVLFQLDVTPVIYLAVYMCVRVPHLVILILYVHL